MATATDKCVEWPYVTNKSGYPILKWEGTTHLGTTVVATLAHGPKMEGAECRHLCGRRRCLNPAHLRWGTKVEQWQDRRRHGTA